jgi:hypothetical protein
LQTQSIFPQQILLCVASQLKLHRSLVGESYQITPSVLLLFLYNLSPTLVPPL